MDTARSAHPRDREDPALLLAREGLSKQSRSRANLLMFHVYIMASRRNGTLYIDSTDSLNRHVFEHRTGAISGFTQRYGVKTPVWHEPHETRESAFLRARAAKTWNRVWKLQLMERKNSNRRNLALELEP